MKSFLFFLFFCFYLSVFSQNLVVDTILISGNKSTQDFVIRNELPVMPGDTVKKSELTKIKVLIHDNVFNTGLFNYVYVYDSILPSNRIILKVRVEERWYIWPYPILEHADVNFTNFLLGEHWNRVNYGAMLMWYNFRGRRDFLKVKFREGYKKQYGVAYLNPYLFKTRKFAYYLELNLNKWNEIPIDIAGNKLVYVAGDASLYNDLHAGGFFSYRPTLFSSFYLKMNLHDARLNLPESAGGQRIKYGDYELSYVLDKRNITYFPTSGFFFSVSSSLRSENNGQITKTFFRLLKVDMRKYYEFGNKWYPSFRFFFNDFNAGNKLTVLNLDYLTSNNIRNYELYVLPMRAAFQTELKYNLVPVKIKKLNFIKSDKFNKPFFSIYTGVYADVGYRTSCCGITGEKYLYSAGISLYFVTYYDKLIRVAAGINSFNENVVSIDFVASF